MKQAWIVLLAFLLSCSASAEIEKTALTCKTTICFYWWPKLPEVRGWHQDREQSYEFSANVLVPNGSTFSDAETVMYAEALYKPRIPETKTVEALIAGDEKRLLNDKPGIKVAESRGMVTGDGKLLRSVTFSPRQQGDWEQVSYGEEGDFYLIFTVSSRTKAAYQRAASTYVDLIKSYREKPLTGRSLPSRSRATARLGRRNYDRRTTEVDASQHRDLPSAVSKEGAAGS